ncbi:MAG: HAD-IC family P-type ATPase, partial [Hymenobacteraceae bacterium]|nr:HAD-IC family P-type ATPase [Hymenobacteraceae bacterium]
MLYHHQETSAILQQLQANTSGLSEDEVRRRQEKYGPNVLPAKKPPSLWYIFMIQFKNPLIYVLLLAVAVSVLLEEYTDALFIGIVLLLNAIIGTAQEWKAEQSAASLQSLLKIMAQVRRGGRKATVDAEELVPGDIVLLESGARVPADLRLLEVQQLKVDESFLTGESEAVEKNLEPVDENASIGDRKNMAFAGSTVLYGRATGIVTATASHTEIGKISKTVSQASAAKPPLMIRLEHLSRQIAFIMLFVTAVIGVVAYTKGFAWDEIFFMAVALVVSAIPEGLPVAITVALSIATTRMAKRNVIIRRLTAVEGLGSCTFIASDKTGTLTVNKQTVKKVVLPEGKVFDVSGEGYNGEGSIEEGEVQPYSENLKSLVKAAAISNEGTLVFKDEGWQSQGDAMDIALLALAYKAGVDPHAYKEEVELMGEVPYESERKYAAAFYRRDGQHLIAIKGALEALLPRCTSMLTANGPVPVNAEAVEAQAVNLTQAGYRVLAIASGNFDEHDRTLNENSIHSLQLLGLTGFIDPLRPEVKDAVDACNTAGVTVAIVTGDHPLTALAIARELHIAQDMSQVVSGAELEAAGDPQGGAFREMVQGKRVFARVAPLQKMHIADALQESGHFVAVTGDGVNDVPALKRANIGVAMGSGTDLAKETAEIIVTDDNFSSIKAGIEGGRHAYDNIRKVTYLLVSTGAAEIVLFVLSVVAGLPIPLTPVQLLWLNLVTNGFQHIALAFEKGEEEAMMRPPRKPAEGIFNQLMIEQTVTVAMAIGLLAFGLWYWLLNMGYSEFEARNLVLMLMVFIENVHVFNCRSELKSAFKVPLWRNPLIIVAVI